MQQDGELAGDRDLGLFEAAALSNARAPLPQGPGAADLYQHRAGRFGREACLLHETGIFLGGDHHELHMEHPHTGAVAAHRAARLAIM